MEERCCGSRVAGAVYVDIPLSPFGTPLEDFLVDPPVVVDKDDLGITPRGVRLIERNGITHIFDWVGQESYPNVADFVEEAKHMGISRRLSSKLDFTKLTSDSRLILLHSRASIENSKDYHTKAECPKSIEEHNDKDTMCIRLWWEDIQGGETIEVRKVLRKMPSCAYEGMCRPEGVEPEYQLAIFASFHIPRLVVIKDPDDNTHERNMEKAKQGKIPVVLVDG